MDWTFQGHPTTKLSHGIFSYPAALHPMIAKTLVQMYGRQGGVMLDPFIGSGTTVAEARLAGMEGVGFDINPAALLVSTVKSQDYSPSELDEYIEAITQLIEGGEVLPFKKSIGTLNLSVEEAESWYPMKTLQELAMILKIVQSYSNIKLQQLGLIVIGQLLRDLSYQRKREAKKYREEGWRDFTRNEKYRPVIPIFNKRLKAVANSMAEFSRCLLPGSKSPNILLFDSASKSDFPEFAKSIDLVITSPPYGDSSTTMAYEQFSWFTNNGLGLDTRVDGALGREMLGGGKEIVPTFEFGHRFTDSALKQMSEATRLKNAKFLTEYYISICNVAKHVKMNGIACYIVGNRTWKGAGSRRLRLDLFTKWAFESNGFKLIGKIITRDVINKSQPYQTSNDGVSGGEGEIVDGMNKEYIVRLRKISEI